MKIKYLGFLPLLLLNLGGINYLIHPHAELNPLTTLVETILVVEIIFITIIGVGWALS